MNQIELLAPAGNKESFIGAINAGANAVYVSGKLYGARKYAANFTKEEIKELIEYAHLRNVSVFVTINTIIFEDEIIGLFEYADYLVRNHVDALIIQDIGIIEEFCKRYPDTEIHASTQMNAYNLEQVKYLKSIGVSRVILARETSVNDIKRIKKEVDIDIEVFIHGALCVSYSGNCLFSYFNGGRSGNRGECAQPCRLEYSLLKDNFDIGKKGYLMSTKDLLTIDSLNDIVEAGATSLKIEGRMKKPSYVISTVRAYKEALLNLYNKTFDVHKRIKELKIAFNREYTKGYILNEQPYNINNSYRPNHQGIEIGTVLKSDYGKVTIKLSADLSVGDGIRILGRKDIGGVVSRILINNEKVDTGKKSDIIVIDILGIVDNGSKVMKTMDKSIEVDSINYLSMSYKLIPLDINLKCRLNEKLCATVKSPNKEIIELESDYIVQKAKKKSQSKEMIEKQFVKFGNTIYYINEIKTDIDDLVFVPNSALNELRRAVVSQLDQQSIIKKSPRIYPVEHKTLDIQNQNNISVKVETLEQYEACKELGITKIYPSMNLKVDQDNIYSNRIIKNYKKLIDYTNIIINDYGGISLLNQNRNIISNYHMNISNSYSLYYLYAKGIEMATVSIESTYSNTKTMVSQFKKKYKTKPNLEVLIYGKIDNMISKYCPITKSVGVNKLDCDLCVKNQYSLRNDSGQKFSLIRDTHCNIRVLSDKPINRISEIEKYKSIGVDNIRVEFTNESSSEVKRILGDVIRRFN